MSEIGPAVAVDALLSWWTLAGVDMAVSELPMNWLRPIPAPPPRSHAVAPSPGPGQGIAAAPPVDRFPETLGAFQAWLADSPTLIEAAWAGPRLAPVGPANARLMVVCDMPDIADGDQGALLSGEAGQLFDAMLRAIGIAREHVYIAALAAIRPPGGMMTDSDEAALAMRMRHHIRLADPQGLLLLGERTSRALTATGTSEKGHALRSVNHEGGRVPAVAIRHPRFLLKQAGAKADSWRALQFLIEDSPS
jgi:DNA polymerase